MNNIDKRLEYLNKKFISMENKFPAESNLKTQNNNIEDNFQDELHKIIIDIKNIREAQNLDKDKISYNSEQLKLIIEKMKNLQLPKIENTNANTDNLIRNEDLEQTQKNIDDLKSYFDNKILEMNIKIELLLNKENKDIASPKSRKNSTNSNNKPSENYGFLNELFNKLTSLEKSHKELEKRFRDYQSSFNMSDIKDEFAKLKDIKANKFDIPDLTEINKIINDHSSKYKQLLSEVNNLDKKMEQIYSNFGDKDFTDLKNLLDSTNLKEILYNYLSKDEYDTDMKQIKEELLKIMKEIDNLKDNKKTIFETLKKKVDLSELNDMKIFLLDKMDELAKGCTRKFAEKNECLSNFKNIEEQLKKILTILRKKKINDDKPEKWLLAKKPIGGYSCASCESYLGLLKDDVKKYIPWNRLPLHESEEKIYRMGSGYSKMLQMIDFNKDGYVNISPEFFDGYENDELGNCNNSKELKMSKTFYSGSKNNKKLKSKMRTQSANNELMANGKIYLSEDTKNKNVFPKVNNDISDEKFIKKEDENGMKSPKITKIFKKGNNKFMIRNGSWSNILEKK